jgi:hypothetical protein
MGTTLNDSDAQVQVNTTRALLVYEQIQKAKLSLDAKKYALIRALENEIDPNRYDTETAEIDNEYIEKRASAFRHGRIPGKEVT